MTSLADTKRLVMRLVVFKDKRDYNISKDRRHLHFRRALSGKRNTPKCSWCLLTALLVVMLALFRYTFTEGLLDDGKISRWLPRLLREIRRSYMNPWGHRLAHSKSEPLFKFSQFPPVHVISLKRSQNRFRGLGSSPKRSM